MSIIKTKPIKLFLNQLELLCEIGAHDYEKNKRQKITIDVEVDIHLPQLPDNDDLDEVFDYDKLRNAVADIALSMHHNLQETLCTKILKACLAHDEIQAVTVKTCKLDVYPDCQSVCCQMSASKAS